MANTSLEQMLQDIKNRIDLAQKKQIRAEHVHDSAKAAAEKIRIRLIDEFGVETSEQASAMLKSLEQQLREAIERAQSALKKAE